MMKQRARVAFTFAAFTFACVAFATPPTPPVEYIIRGELRSPNMIIGEVVVERRALADGQLFSIPPLLLEIDGHGALTDIIPQREQLTLQLDKPRSFGVSMLSARDGLSRVSIRLFNTEHGYTVARKEFEFEIQSGVIRLISREEYDSLIQRQREEQAYHAYKERMRARALEHLKRGRNPEYTGPCSPSDAFDRAWRDVVAELNPAGLHCGARANNEVH